MLCVNLCNLWAKNLQAINDTLKSPCPHAICSIINEFGIETHKTIIGSAGISTEL